jgi:hypothetical protein
VGRGPAWVSWDTLLRGLGRLPFFLYSNYLPSLFKYSTSKKYKSKPSLHSKFSKLCMLIENFNWNNFHFWFNIQISLDFKLQNSEINSNLNFKGVQTFWEKSQKFTKNLT